MIGGKYIFLCTESINGCPANSSMINPKLFDPSASFQWRDLCASQASSLGGSVHGNSNSGTCIVTVGGTNEFYGIGSRTIEGEEGEEKTLPLETVAQKVISNAESSEDEVLKLLSEDYISLVANSVFDSNPSKQFVKLEDLIPQLETNKILR